MVLDYVTATIPTWDERHRIVFTVLNGIEEAMVAAGFNIPLYTQHRVSEVRMDLNKEYVPCRRCQFNAKFAEDEMGTIGECGQFKYADGEPLLSCRTDGCSRGMLREEYRK